MGLVSRLVVGSVEVVASACQTGFHYGEVLVGQCQIDDQFGLVVVEQCLELLHIVGIHLCGAYGGIAYVLHYAVAFLLATRGYHKLSKYLGVLRYLDCGHGGHTTSTYHKYSSHSMCVLRNVCVVVIVCQ